MPQTQILTVGSLFLAAGTALEDNPPRRHVDLGPEHPSRSGVLLVEVECDDDVVTAARVQPGFNHRSVEKLFEVRDYRQCLVLADRHDWHSPFTGELGMALACERLMGLTPPERATWLRMALAEHARITSHLAHLSFVGHRLRDESLAAEVRGVREAGRAWLLAVSGNRVHPMLNRLGGLAVDLPASQVERLAAWAGDASRATQRIREALTGSGLGNGLGPIAPELVDQLGLGGPVAAACGLGRDLRREGNYLAYSQVQQYFAAPTGTPQPGDAAQRLRELCDEVTQSAALISACVEKLHGIDGPVDTKLSKIVKLPDCEGYLAIAAPWGIAGFHVVSRAQPTPWRMRLRTPALANVQALENALVNCPIQDVDIVLASLGWTAGDLDK